MQLRTWPKKKSILINSKMLINDFIAKIPDIVWVYPDKCWKLLTGTITQDCVVTELDLNYCLKIMSNQKFN